MNFREEDCHPGQNQDHNKDLVEPWHLGWEHPLENSRFPWTLCLKKWPSTQSPPCLLNMKPFLLLEAWEILRNHWYLLGHCLSSLTFASISSPGHQTYNEGPITMWDNLRNAHPAKLTEPWQITNLKVFSWISHQYILPFTWVLHFHVPKMLTFSTSEI